VCLLFLFLFLCCLAAGKTPEGKQLLHFFDLHACAPDTPAPVAGVSFADSPDQHLFVCDALLARLRFRRAFHRSLQLLVRCHDGVTWPQFLILSSPLSPRSCPTFALSQAMPSPPLDLAAISIVELQHHTNALALFRNATPRSVENLKGCVCVFVVKYPAGFLACVC